MNDPGQLQNEKTAVGGIKFSQELVLINVSGGAKALSDFNTLLKQFSDTCIPILFLCRSGTPSHWYSSFCVDVPDRAAACSILNQQASLSNDLTTVLPVGLLTVFPHGNNIELLARLLNVFTPATAPLYGFCTSISATIFCTDYLLLNTVADAMLNHIQLPENHAPFRPEFILKQPR